MKAFTIQFTLISFLSLLPFSIFSGDRPTAIQIAAQYAQVAAYLAKKDVMKARRKLTFETRKFQADLHKKASARAYEKAYQAPSSSSIMPPAVFAKEYDSFLHKKPLLDHVAAWKNNNVPFLLERKRYLTYCKQALLTARINEINEFKPPYKPIVIPNYSPTPPTLK